jgi:hypothetical protein
LVVGDIIQQMSDRYRMDTTHRLQMGRPQNNDFSIEVSFRGIRHQFMDSPARGRFEALRGEMQKLAWLVAIIKVFRAENGSLIIVSQFLVSIP